MSTPEQLEVLAAGPALVDCAVNVQDDHTFQRILDELSINPGEWCLIEDFQQISQIFRLVLEDESFSDTDLEQLFLASNLNFIAGSTGLGVLSALSPEQRVRSAYLSAVGTGANGQPDTFSDYFSKQASDIGITHHYFAYPGTTPLGLVMSSPSTAEKTLAMYPGVSRELSRFPEGIQPRLVYLDAYELQAGPIADFLTNLINMQHYPVALGLSNKSILTPELCEKIQAFMTAGKLEFLMGNHEEFSTLLGREVKVDMVEDLQYISSMVPHTLITFGAQGIVSISDNQLQYQAAISPETIVNTSGAGDTVAGVYISGVLAGQPMKETLELAVEYAAQVLSIPGSRLPKGR